MENLTERDIKNLNSKKGLQALLSDEEVNVGKALKSTNYVKSLKSLQKELIKMHTEVIEKNERVIVIFEGRDAAGKGGAIRRITERINPRHFRIVALPKPTEEERTQWYFQRYIRKFPKAGEIVFFDRSWYNRAVVEPVNGFCTQEEYVRFMNNVNDFERMITSSGIKLVKIYMSISKEEQSKRFEEIKNNPLKQWKITPVDEKAQELWNEYTRYKAVMFENTNTDYAPWKIIRANRKTFARINAIKYLLSRIPYDKTRKV
ncbi:polyphosphate kinase 2 [Wenyingzhuangia sp. 2_MG-2023]|uniref:polyphosphate kinase 2 n=1 Tax=Wenyingzhuangia sp. 2_MG-2023 TaxID=3062639 RepID=UPI0026E27ED0|nr:polyphosphate kinase 2 [Wenyingzhuangia sp. 2_MG-2023]MDO6738103.1 polyphosphate kinase 2 [Wenyingzhuangia sp. 2_MG-2023]MDO6801573.1 polyphosphate kinase 2 [Wenyingzhuangia sp. 1_MG-2023]